MIEANKNGYNSGANAVEEEDTWPGIDSRFRLIVVAALRSKQLQRGSHPRIEVNPLKRRNTSIALEEVKQGLVPFTITHEEPQTKINSSQLPPKVL